MGYNFAEAFEPEEPYEEEVLRPEFLLLQNRLASFIDNLLTKLKGEDPDVIFLVQSQLHKEFYLAQYKKIDEQLDFLQEKSEELIESPDANKPDVLEQRKDYAKQINFLLDIQAELKEELEKAEQDRLAGSLIAKEKHTQAQVFVEQISKDMNNAIHPPADLE